MSDKLPASRLEQIGVKALNSVKAYGVRWIKNSRNLLFSDTTLRDGEQAPGAAMQPEQKLEIARMLADLGVDSIEAGFASASPMEFEGVRKVANEVRGPLIMSLSLAEKQSIDRTYNALKGAWKKGITLFLGSSKSHREDKMGKSRQEIIDMTAQAVSYASKMFVSVAFGPEDASRTEPDFLYQIYDTAIEAGASCIGFADTVGYLVPAQVNKTVTDLKTRVKGIDTVFLAVHMHNNLGLATANTLAAVEAGADIVQGTINGIGEGSGNASLAEVIMALTVRRDHYKVPLRVDTTRLKPLSDLVETYSRMGRARQTPIVGENVFATTAGVHQAGFLKNPETYCIFPPEDVGQDGLRILLSRHSGRTGLISRLKELGYRSESLDMNRVYQDFICLADRQKLVSDDELRRILNDAS